VKFFIIACALNQIGFCRWQIVSNEMDYKPCMEQAIEVGAICVPTQVMVHLLSDDPVRP
jgi:hypothetical protein